MNRTIRVLAVAMLLPVSGVILAHHSVAMFDTETAVTVQGKVVRFELTNPHSFVYVEQETREGPIVWALEGPPPNRLEPSGIGPDSFREGDAVEACGYVLKEDAAASYSNRRVLVAEVLVMPGGEPRLWSPYGNKHCRDGGRYPNLIE
jgi:hypothetical protein